jgi:two-component system, LuxR family, sensor kinase FixL
LNDIQQYIFYNLETYRDLFDNAHDLIHIVEPNGNVLYVNNSWSTVLGYSISEVQGRSIYSIVDEKDKERFRAYRQMILSGGDSRKEVIVAFRSKHGRLVQLEGFVSPKIVEGQALYTRGIFRDITRRMENEAKLQAINAELIERQTNLHNLLFYAPDAVIVIDDNSHITYWNPKAEQIFGWTSEEVMGKRLTEIIIPIQFRAAHDEGMKRYLHTGQIHVLNKTIEITALNREGNEFYVSLTISQTSQQGRAAFIAFLRDIDQQKRNAIELEQKKLQLEESNKQLESFAHVASHDMKEPIRKIQLFTERVRSDEKNTFSAESQRYLLRVAKAAERLTEIVEGVLTFSSLKADQSPFESVDLNEVIHHVEQDLEMVIQKRHAQINYENLPIIDGVPFLLRQLFYNLISNSLKFSKVNTIPKVVITCRTLSNDEIKSMSLRPNTHYCEIVVEDNGIGFPQEYAQDIFATFYRLHNKDQFEGTGLGLSLCKNIVTRHNGTITALSSPNQGASFIITLPLRQS